MNFKRINLIIVIALAILAGCKKPDLYPDTPVIAFKSIAVQQDASDHDISAHLVISFTDGDGDLGNSPSGASDFIVKMDTLSNGIWGQIEDPQNILFSGSIPYLTPEGNNKALKGDIATDVPLPLIGYPDDTVRFEVYILDRALHKSNVITTPEIIIHTE